MDDDNLTAESDMAPREKESVQYYKPYQIEEAFRNARSFEEVKNKLKNNYSNRTEHHLDKLFEYWDHFPTNQKGV